MKNQSSKTNWLLPIAIAVTGVLLVIAATAEGLGTDAGPEDLAQPEAFPLFWAEDLSSPLPPDTYYITATTSSGMVDSGSFLLTQSAGYQRGRIFYLAPTAMAQFSATFHLYLGSDDGGGYGAAFQFCPVYAYPPDSGGMLDVSCPGGYLVAFDTWEDGGGGPDRVYVAYETPSNRLAVANVDNLEDGAWHTATVLLQQPFITVTLDGSDVIAGAELPGYTPFLGYFGFSAATGMDFNEQRVDDIQVYSQGAPSSIVDGYVTDAATGWPLYASVDTNSPVGMAWTDPETGYYSISLPDGMAFDFHVEAWVPGYIPEDRVVGPLASDTTENFGLDADPAACIAPGYQKTYGFFDDFGGGVGNWTLSGLWNFENEFDACGLLVAPFPSSSNAVYYGQDGICTYDTGAANSGELTLISPVTLPNFGGTLRFTSYEETECNGDCDYDNRYVEISNDDGATWDTLGEGDTEDSWYLKAFDLSTYGGDSVLFRFRFDTIDPVNNDYFGWMVDSVAVATGCVPQPGGLVVGNVYDENTLDPVVGAKVENDTGGETYALPTPGDPDVDDAFYTLFSPPGDHLFTASYMPPYGTHDETVAVVGGDTVGQVFFLAAPHLVLEPEELEAWVLYETPLYAHPTGLDLTNDGGLPLDFELVEISGTVAFASAAAQSSVVPDGSTGPRSGPEVERVEPVAPSSRYAPDGACLVAVTADDGNGPNEIAQLHATLDEFGFGWLDVTTVQEARDAGADVLIDRYAGWNMPYSDINDWLTDGYGYVELGDWPAWFPDDWEGQPAGTPLSIAVADSGHPLAKGLPAAWTGLGFWAYDWDSDALGWVTDAGYPNVVEAQYGILQQRVVTGEEVGPGRAAYIGINTYGYKANDPDKQVLRNAIEWTGACGLEDVPWFWEDPVSGTVPAETTQSVTVEFTALYPDLTPMPLGDHYATLVVNSNDPVSDTRHVPVTMHIVEAFITPTASFESNSPVCVDTEMVFTNTTTVGVPAETDYLWDFGDGETSAEFQLSHVYAAPGTYDVTLEACNLERMCDTFEDTVEVLSWPQAGFAYEVAGSDVSFTNTSLDALSHEWDFGDGTGSTEENPVHTYAAGGTYTVLLTATNDCAIDVYSEQVVVVGYYYYYYLPLLHKNYE